MIILSVVDATAANKKKFRKAVEINIKKDANGKRYFSRPFSFTPINEK